MSNRDEARRETPAQKQVTPSPMTPRTRSTEFLVFWIRSLYVPEGCSDSQLDFGRFRPRMREHSPFGARYGLEFLYGLGLAGT
jgi:hypothetical protein